MFKKVLVTLDGSELAEKALATAERIAKENNATLYVVSVFEAEQALASPVSNFDTYHLVVTTEQTKKRAEAYLETVKAKLLAEETDCIANAVESIGSVSGTILSLADDIEADLIIMTSHGYTGMRRLVMGSVTNEVICGATCPVMVVPAI